MYRRQSNLKKGKTERNREERDSEDSRDSRDGWDGWDGKDAMDGTDRMHLSVAVCVLCSHSLSPVSGLPLLLDVTLLATLRLSLGFSPGGSGGLSGVCLSFSLSFSAFPIRSIILQCFPPDVAVSAESELRRAAKRYRSPKGPNLYNQKK